MLRIIGGEWSGRLIKVPEDGGVRPTSDRIRKTLFDILGPSVQGATVLDCFAGSGAAGLEALSRGSGSVVFVESSSRVVQGLRRSITELDAANRCEIIQADWRAALRRLIAARRTFDLIFADPPYKFPEYGALLSGAGLAAILAPKGRAILEHFHKASVLPGPEGLALKRSVRHGDTVLSFFKHSTEVKA